MKIMPNSGHSESPADMNPRCFLTLPSMAQLPSLSKQNDTHAGINNHLAQYILYVIYLRINDY